MWNIWSRIVRPKKRKAVSFEVGMAYDVMGQTMVVMARYDRMNGQIVVTLAPVEEYRGGKS
jgi:hypothetical protein